jgi:hypothetical protein
MHQRGSACSESASTPADMPSQCTAVHPATKGNGAGRNLSLCSRGSSGCCGCESIDSTQGQHGLTELIYLKYVHAARVNKPVANMCLVLPCCELQTAHSRTMSLVRTSKASTNCTGRLQYRSSYCERTCRAVTPCFAGTSAGTEHSSTSQRQISRWPLRAAKCNGVRPVLFAVVTSEPRSCTSHLHTVRCPFPADQCSAAEQCRSAAVATVPDGSSCSFCRSPSRANASTSSAVMPSTLTCPCDPAWRCLPRCPPPAHTVHGGGPAGWRAS